MLAMYKRQLLSVAKRVDAGSDTQRSLEKRAARIQDKIRSRAHNLFGPFDETTGFGNVALGHYALYSQNGAIYIFTIKSFLKNKSIPKKNIIPFFMSESDSLDINYHSDLKK